MGSKEQFFSGLGSNERRCYVQVSRIRQAVEDPKVLDALMDVLDVPGKRAVLKKLTNEQKFEAIAKQIDHHQSSKTSEWHGSLGGEILASAIWRADLSGRYVERELFSDVRTESALLAPVARWLRSQGLHAHAEIPLGKKRVDLLGYREPGWLGLRAHQFIAVELKNDVKEMERGIDQMSTYADYAHRVYLACTPAMAAEYLSVHADARGVKHWDASVFDRKLQKLGFGLLLVEGDTVHERLKPKEYQVLGKNVDEVLSAMSDRTKLHEVHVNG